MNVILTTARLVLREFTVDDAPFIVQLLNTPGWLQHIGDRKVRTTEEGAAYLERIIINGYRTIGYGFWLVERKGDHVPVGMCGIYQRDYLECPDIGYALLPEYEGQGYATEAATATLRLAHEQFGFIEICAIVTPVNHSSIRVLERIGMTFKKSIVVPPDSEELSLFSDER